jgi:hypothetical protein
MILESDITALNERFVDNVPKSEFEEIEADFVMVLPDHDSCREYNAYEIKQNYF